MYYNIYKDCALCKTPVPFSSTSVPAEYENVFIDLKVYTALSRSLFIVSIMPKHWNHLYSCFRAQFHIPTTTYLPLSIPLSSVCDYTHSIHHHPNMPKGFVAHKVPQSTKTSTVAISLGTVWPNRLCAWIYISTIKNPVTFYRISR